MYDTLALKPLFVFYIIRAIVCFAITIFIFAIFSKMYTRTCERGKPVSQGMKAEIFNYRVSEIIQFGNSSSHFEFLVVGLLLTEQLPLLISLRS